jgi:hypothetical protein
MGSRVRARTRAHLPVSPSTSSITSARAVTRFEPVYNPHTHYMTILAGPLRNRLATALAGRYQGLREIGAGGMAVVNLAHDVKHDRDVAIKVRRDDVAHRLDEGVVCPSIRRCDSRPKSHANSLFP